MRVIVIGGTGNISTAIVQLLLDKGHEVTVFNRGKRTPPPEGVRVIIGDRYNYAEFEATMQRETFDVAIDMITFNKADAESSIRAFRGVQHFIQTSTVVTYGLDYDWLPVSEDHELRPIIPYGIHKAEADKAYLAAYYTESFPVTIIKPSTTFGPKQGLLRQLGIDLSWVDRIRKNKPIIVCGDGNALHQFMHVDDAALGYVGVVGKSHTIGQVYNLVNPGFTKWSTYHKAMMSIIGNEVEMVGVPLDDLIALNVPHIDLCRDIFAHHTIYDSSKLMRDVPEFHPQITVEDMLRGILTVADADGRIPNSDDIHWEDEVIAAQRAVRQTQIIT